MDWLNNFNGWGFGAVAIACGTLLGIVALIRNKRINSKLFQYGDDGKPVRDENGRIVMAQTAMADHDAEKLAAIISRSISHDCIRTDYLKAGFATIEPHVQITKALADRAIADGANGLIKDGIERLAPALDKFREVREDQSFAKAAG